VPTDLPKKTDSAYLQILEKIHIGSWKVGDRIPNELELADQFNCSRGTVGKALARLSYEGLVERKPKVGTIVTRASLERASKAFNVDGVAFIFPSEKHDGIWRTVTGFQAMAQEVGSRVMMLTTGTDFKKEVEFIGSLNEFNVRGAVIYLVIQTPQAQVYISQLLARSKFPIVLACVNLPGMNLPAVIFDDFHASYTMTKHLIQRGCRRIGFLSSSRAPDGCNGYAWALQEAGRELNSDLVSMEQNLKVDLQHPVREPREVGEVYLRAHPEVDAVVCGYDFQAIGLIQAAQALGRRVPDDLCVTGVDDFNISSPVPLTTYHVPYEDIGRKAFEILAQQIRGEKSALLTHRLRGEIVVRESA
jgi:GntR family transcriptional regulator of arabinose operon